ncbi:MAG: M20/M25/M40 family metallo-hydrolase [Methanobacteriota archaeon]
MRKLLTVMVVLLFMTPLVYTIISTPVSSARGLAPMMIPGDISKQSLNQILGQVSTDVISSSSVTIAGPTVYFYDAVSRIIGEMHSSLLLQYLEELTSFGPRVTGYQGCQDAGRYLYQEFAEMGLQVRYQNWTYNSVTVSNIEASLPGVDPSSDEIYIICGHYDTVSGSPGADDDGSGVALVLAAAWIMREYQFNHTVRFVAFCGEEQGLLGSYEYVEEAYQHQDHIVAVLNADMIGYAETLSDESQIKLYYDDASTWILQYTTSVGQLYNGQIGLTIIPSGFTWGSDHYSFWSFGYNAVFYHEYHFNEYYHSSQDTIAHMNLYYTTKCSRLIMATLVSLAEVIPSVSPYELSGIGI